MPRGVRSFRTKRVGEEAKELEAKSESQEYGKVLSMLGDRRFRAHCMDGKERICHIPGRFAKRMWIAVGDIVLLSIRDFEPDKADLLEKYTAAEARELQKKGWLSEVVGINEGTAAGGAVGGDAGKEAADVGFEFDVKDI